MNMLSLVVPRNRMKPMPLKAIAPSSLSASGAGGVSGVSMLVSRACLVMNAAHDTVITQSGIIMKT